MPHSLFVPDYDEDGRLITDQRQLRIRNESRTPEIDRLAHQSLQARDEAIKAAHIQAEQKTKAEKEFQANAQAAAKYGIPPQALSPAGMGVAQMLDAEQELNARFEAKKQELAQKYQGPDAGNIVRELDELHQTQDRELTAKFANNPLAEQAIAARAQEFRSQAANWLQGEIQTKQQQYFDAVDKKCNDALTTQISGMQPERFSGALATRENEMRALGRTPSQIQAAKQALIGSYLQNLAVTAPSAFFEALKQPAAKERAASGSARPGAEGSALANKPQNILSRFAETLPEEELGRLSRMAEKTRTELEKKEEFAKINMRQQEILQELTGLDPAVQRAEIEKITAGMEERKMADTLKTRLSLHLDYEDAVRAARDWETGTKILQEDFGPLEKLEAIATANISEAAREALIREVMGEPAPETPENREAALDAIKKVGSGAIQSERQLYAICQQQGLTRSQAALLGDAFAGNGRVNGVPVGMAINALQQRDPSLANNPAALLGATERFLRDWPEGMMPTMKNIQEQSLSYKERFNKGEYIQVNGSFDPSHMPDVQQNPIAANATGEGTQIKFDAGFQGLENSEQEARMHEEYHKNPKAAWNQDTPRSYQSEIPYVRSFTSGLNKMDAQGAIDEIVKMSPRQKGTLYGELLKAGREEISKPNVQSAFLVLSNGEQYARDYVELKRQTAPLDAEAHELNKEMLRLADLIDKTTRKGSPEYNQLNARYKRVNEDYKAKQAIVKNLWNEFEQKHDFEASYPPEFVKARRNEVAAWNAALSKQESADKLKGWVHEINATSDPAQKKQLLREMLNYAIIEAGIPMSKLSIYKMESDMRGRTGGDWVAINEGLLEQPLQLDVVLDTLFHEAGHVIVNTMPQAERSGIHNSYYLPPRLHPIHYKHQKEEVFAHYMGEQGSELGKQIMKGVNDASK